MCVTAGDLVDKIKFFLCFAFFFCLLINLSDHIKLLLKRPKALRNSLICFHTCMNDALEKDYTLHNN